MVMSKRVFRLSTSALRRTPSGCGFGSGIDPAELQITTFTAGRGRSGKIEAQLSNGVLRLTIPVRLEAKPRRIQANGLTLCNDSLISLNGAEAWRSLLALLHIPARLSTTSSAQGTEGVSPSESVG
jgi:hypothetical protein